MPKHIVQSESQIVSAKWSKWSDIPKKAAVLIDFVQIRLQFQTKEDI